MAGHGKALVHRRGFLAGAAGLVGGATSRTNLHAGSTTQTPGPISRVSDAIWMWGIEVNGHHTEKITSIGKASQITAWDAARRLGIPNLMMCGAGQLTPTESHAGQITRFRRVVWELHDFDDPVKGASNLAAIQSVAARHHNVEAVLLDDMTSLAIGKRGMEPTILAKLARQLQERPRPLMLWGVVYTMNLELPRIKEYLNLLNVVNLWTWVGKELWSLEANFKKAEELAGGKPIVMGLYLWDFGANRSLSLDLMEHQCTVSLNLLKQRRLSGIVFLSSAVCDLGLESVEWVRSWIQKVGAQTLG